MSTDARFVRKIIREELPKLATGDRLLRELIYQLSQHKELASDPDETNGDDLKIESPLTRIMVELKRETKAQLRQLDQNREEIRKLREEIRKNQAEIQRIHRVVDAFDRENDVGLGSLIGFWGY